MSEPNYTVGRGKVFVGRVGETGERYVGNSPGFSYNPTVNTLKTMKSVGGIVLPDQVYILSAEDEVSLQLDDISTDNLAMFFRASGEQKIVDFQFSEYAMKVRAGHLYQLTQGPLQDVVATFEGEEIDLGSNFQLYERIGLIEVLARPLDLYDGQELTLTFKSGRVTREGFQPNAVPHRGSLRYIENNLIGMNRMFFWPVASFLPAQGIDFKADAWRILEFTVSLLGLPQIVDTELVDDYGFADNVPELDVDFGIVTNDTMIDDYGVQQ